MQRERRKKLIASVAMVLWMVTFHTGWTIAAEEEKKAEAPAEAPKAEASPATPAAPGAPAAAAPAPKLPPYFTATSPDPKTTLWPDPTGANTGVWATPAGDGKGDIPEKLSIQDV
jgi:hypothetical protein